MIRSIRRVFLYVMGMGGLLGALFIMNVPEHPNASVWRDDVYAMDALVYRIGSEEGRAFWREALSQLSSPCMYAISSDLLPQRCATFVSWAAMQLKRLDRYAEALRLEEAARQVRTQFRESHPLDLAQVDFHQAQTLLELGEEKKALERLDEATSEVERHLGGEDLVSALVRARYAIAVYYIESDCRGTGELFDHAIRIMQKSGISFDPQLIVARAYRALVFADCDSDLSLALQQQKALLNDVRSRRGDHDYFTAMVMINLATTLEHRGEVEEALAYYTQALVIFEQQLGGHHHDVHIPLTGMAGLYVHQGNYPEAAKAIQRAVEILRVSMGANHVALIRLWVSLADVMRFQGFFDEALADLDQAIRLQHLHGLDDHPEAIRQLLDKAAIQRHLHRDDEAIPLLQHVIALNGELPVLPDPYALIAGSDLAGIYADQGRLGEALHLQENNLERGVSHWGPWSTKVAYATKTLAYIESVAGRHKKALALYRRALLIEVMHEGLDDEDTLDDLEEYASEWEATHEGLPLAIALMKMSLLHKGGLPGEENVSEPASGLSAHNGLSDSDRYLSRLLWKAGRLDEMKMLPAIRMTTREKSLIQPLEKQFTRLHNQKLKLDGLRDGLGDSELLPERQALLQALESRSLQSLVSLDQTLSDLAHLFRQEGSEQKRKARSEAHQHEAMKSLMARMGSDVALLDYRFEEERLVLQVGMKGEIHTHVLPVPQEKVNALVRRFLREMKQAELTTSREIGYELYKLLVLPVRAKLDQQGIHHLLLSMEGVLAFLPMTALYDGHHYLLESYSVSLFEPSLADGLSKPPITPRQWQIAALGVSQGGAMASALPHVPEEVHSLIRQKDNEEGWPGKVWLDDAFTEEALGHALQSEYQVLHLASHFVLSPGTEDYGYLVMGKQQILSVETLRKLDFSHIDMLVLSACETAVASGEGPRAGNAGLAGLLQQRGAASVVASFWPVADESTALMMRQFYQSLQNASISKAEALRLSQLALIHHPDFAHPYFWANFQLIGDWR